jgi:hypothetical protein
MKIDLNKILSLHIGGEIAKNHSLPIDYFINISKSLQELILSLATNDLTSDLSIDTNNFKIELCGFKEGSAVPQFKFSDEIFYTNGVNVLNQRKKVSESFERILEISDKGTFEDIIKLYPTPSVRNEVVERIFNYTNSFGNAPVEVVNYTKNGKVINLYKNHKLKPEAKKKLQVEIIKDNEKIEQYQAVGKLTVIKSKKGTKTKVNQVYKETDTDLSYAIDKISIGNKVYCLNSILRNAIGEEDDFFVITSELLDINATGKTVNEAKECFAVEFDYIYTKYNELKDAECSSRILRIKKILNLLVSKIDINK